MSDSQHSASPCPTITSTLWSYYHCHLNICHGKTYLRQNHLTHDQRNISSSIQPSPSSPSNPPLYHLLLKEKVFHRSLKESVIGEIQAVKQDLTSLRRDLGRTNLTQTSCSDMCIPGVSVLHVKTTSREAWTGGQDEVWHSTSFRQFIKSRSRHSNRKLSYRALMLDCITWTDGNRSQTFHHLYRNLV